MRKTIAVTFALAVLTGAVASAAQNSRGELISACQKEAQSGYALAMKMEPSLKNSIVAHRKNLSTACAAFATGKSNSTAMLSNCLHQTSAGPVHIQRGRIFDRPHVARVRELCRALGDAASGGVNPPVP